MAGTSSNLCITLTDIKQLNKMILELVEVKVHSRKRWLTVALDDGEVKRQLPLRYPFYQQGLRGDHI